MKRVEGTVARNSIQGKKVLDIGGRIPGGDGSQAVFNHSTHKWTGENCLQLLVRINVEAICFEVLSLSFMPHELPLLQCLIHYFVSSC